MGGRARIVGLAAVVAVAVLPAVLPAASAPARADVGVVNHDAQGTGWYPNSPGLAPTAVAAADFGQLWSTPVQGQVYAQPLTDAGVIVVATEQNWIYGIDESNGSELWSRQLHLPWNPADVSCGDLTPSIGVTATPVIDTATHTAYLTSKTYASGTSGAAAYWMHAVNVTTGAERAGFPVKITGTADNDSGQSFNATVQLQRPGLLLLDGVVYAGFGGHCDFGSYNGWIAGVPTSGGAPSSLWVAEKGATQAGIWHSGGGLVSDGPGRLFAVTGNGPAPATGAAAAPPPAHLGQSVIRLHPGSGGTLAATDFFAPYDADALNSWDADLGSGAPVLLPDAYGTAAHPHLLTLVGKQGYLYLLDRDDLGGRGQGAAGGDDAVARFSAAGTSRGGVWGKPTPWPGDGRWLWLVTASSGSSAGGTSGKLEAFRYGVDANGVPTLTLAATSSDSFGFSSSSPVVSSDGTTAGSATVWTVWSPNGSGSGAQLRAYDANVTSSTPTLLRSWPVGVASKFAQPAVDGSRVFVGTRDGHLLAFGAPTAVPLHGPAVSFPATVVGQGRQAVATLTADTDVSVTGITSSNPSVVAVGTPSPDVPATLHPGDTIDIPLTFTPSAVGPVAGDLTLATDRGAVHVAWSGTGQAATAEIGATPSTISFGGVRIGDPAVTAGLTLTDTGAAPLTITSIDLPSAPFAVTGLPPAGTVLDAGESATGTVSFHPTTAGVHTDELTVHTTAGDVTVPMSGTGAAGSHLVLSRMSVQFGDLPVGGVRVRSFVLRNTGDVAMTITKSKPPAAGVGFVMATDVPEGTTIEPGGSVVARVAFAPTSEGVGTDQWLVTADDGSGPHAVAVTGTGALARHVLGVANASWQRRGSAGIVEVPDGLVARLTAAGEPNTAGAMYWSRPLRSSYVDVTATVRTGGGGGADGLGFVLLPAKPVSVPASTGRSGHGLGWAGLGGMVVALDTFANTGDPSNNFIGIARHVTAADPGEPDWIATTTTIPSLRATRVLHVRVDTGHVTVWLDGTRVLDTDVALPEAVYAGFTGATGGLTDDHEVSHVHGFAADPRAHLVLRRTADAPARVDVPTLVVRGRCPSALRTRLPDADAVRRSPDGAVVSRTCRLSVADPGPQWKVTVRVPGHDVRAATLGEDGRLHAPDFALRAGDNAVRWTLSYR